jgi:hypothetical protein
VTVKATSRLKQFMTLPVGASMPLDIAPQASMESHPPTPSLFPNLTLCPPPAPLKTTLHPTHNVSHHAPPPCPLPPMCPFPQTPTPPPGGTTWTARST